MPDIAISVESLSKSYLLGHNAVKGESYTALRDVLSRNARDLVRKTRDMIHGRPIIQGDEVEEFWALKDVSFEVRQGETLGVIGRNGAGKSTLLKILSRITEPTKGRITISGRVASLLEVGTGFHPELTGRENIFLNGAILGMRRGEILRKFDEIVAFAEVENFVDTPVKRYSSGMYVRLAFAVAAHLEPEILVVDEVLAVGDVAFQKKCLGKMGDVVDQEGRTVIFVSHNMAAVRTLCARAVLLQQGRVELISDNVDKAVETYVSATLQRSDAGNIAQRTDRQGDGSLRFTAVKIVNTLGEEVAVVKSGEEVRLRLELIAMKAVRDVEIAIALSTLDGNDVLFLASNLKAHVYCFSEGVANAECVLPKFPLPPGEYILRVFSQANHTILDWVRDAARFAVSEGDFYASGKHLPSAFKTVLVDHDWI